MASTNRKVCVFNNVTLDGYFTDSNSDMSWAHRPDEEWNEFITANSRKEASFLFGRITYEMMASFWPTDMAREQMPEVAAAMNGQQKYVASRSLKSADWSNSTILQGDLIEEVRKLKSMPGPDIMIFGSGTIVSQLSEARLIDEYQLFVIPLVLGDGRTMFEGVADRFALKLTGSRSFRNGNMFLCYEPE